MRNLSSRLAIPQQPDWEILAVDVSVNHYPTCIMFRIYVTTKLKFLTSDAKIIYNNIMVHGR
jgi:hypothetical protein